MPDLPMVRFRFYGQGCLLEPTGHLMLNWKDGQGWRLVDWLRSNGQRTVLTGDDPKIGALKFLEGLASFIPEWHKSQQDAIIAESAHLGSCGNPKTMMQQKGFRPQTAGKRWWLFKTDTTREVEHIEKHVVEVLQVLRQWMPEADLIVPPMLFPDPWH